MRLRNPNRKVVKKLLKLMRKADGWDADWYHLKHAPTGIKIDTRDNEISAPLVIRLNTWDSIKVSYATRRLKAKMFLAKVNRTPEQIKADEDEELNKLKRKYGIPV